MKRVARFVLSAALLGAGGGAVAQSTIKIKYMGDTAGALQLTTSETADHGTGHLNYVDDANSSFIAYCIEPLAANAATSLGLRTYTIGGFSGAQGTLLQGLYSSSFSSLVGSKDEAAFQLAVWEIMRETSSSSLNLSTGNFKLTGGADSSAALLAQSNAFLTAAQSYTGPSLYTLTRLTNGTYQDLVVAQIAPVPEPSRMAMMFAGLGAVGFMAARRRRH